MPMFIFRYLHLRNFSRGGIDNFLGESLTSLIRCSLASLHQLAYLRNVFQFGHSATLPPIKTTKMSLFSRNCVIHQLNHSFGEGILKIQLQIHKNTNMNTRIQIHKYTNTEIVSSTRLSIHPVFWNFQVVSQEFHPNFFPVRNT